MSYFRELPNLYYQSQSSDRTSSKDYVLVKNLFRRTKLRDDLQNVFTIFDKYQIEQGERPDTIAEKLYGDSGLDWVVMLTANIINVRDQWPLSDGELYNYVDEKYGTDLYDVRFYETTEVKDSSGRLILPKGQIVDSDFTIPNPSQPRSDLNPVAAVSNYDYEIRENEEKRQIYVLKTEYLTQFVEDMRDQVIYDKSSEYINTNTARTTNTRNTSSD